MAANCKEAFCYHCNRVTTFFEVEPDEWRCDECDSYEDDYEYEDEFPDEDEDD